MSPTTQMGPLVNRTQFDKVQKLIEAGIAEGARLVAGGLGRPDGLDRGYFVRPTVFAGGKPDMTIGREEIFGPVLSLISYENEDDAIRIANDTDYGLACAPATSMPTMRPRIIRRLSAATISRATDGNMANGDSRLSSR